MENIFVAIYGNYLFFYEILSHLSIFGFSRIGSMHSGLGASDCRECENQKNTEIYQDESFFDKNVHFCADTGKIFF